MVDDIGIATALAGKAPAETFAAVSATQAIGVMAPGLVHVGDGTAAVSGTPKRSGLLRVEITTPGEADGGLAKFKWSFQGEALSGELDVKTAGSGGTALGTTGLTVSFTNGTPVSFQVGDYFEATATFAVTTNTHAFAVTIDAVTPTNSIEVLTITDNKVKVGSEILCGYRNDTSTAGFGFAVQNGAAGAGSVAILTTNLGDAFNGTTVLAGRVLNPA